MEHSIAQWLYPTTSFNNDQYFILITFILLLILKITFILLKYMRGKKWRTDEGNFVKSVMPTNLIYNTGNDLPSSHQKHHLMLLFMNAAERCFIREEAEKCKNIVAHFPQLINFKLEPIGLSPFHRVCTYAHVDLIEFMMEKGANPCLDSDGGESPICLVIGSLISKKRGRIMEAIPCLDMLKRAGSSLGEKGIWYDILLRMAIRAGKKELIEWMIRNGELESRLCATSKVKRQSSVWI